METIFEFVVAAPFGASAIEGYEETARHFGLHTLHDPPLRAWTATGCW